MLKIPAAPVPSLSAGPSLCFDDDDEDDVRKVGKAKW